MKKLLLLSGVFAFSLAVSGLYTQSYADGCYICTSNSKDGIQQCKWHGSDTFDQRKKCEKAGCDVGGTTSCSSAANVKVIDPN